MIYSLFSLCWWRGHIWKLVYSKYEDDGLHRRTVRLKCSRCKTTHTESKWAFSKNAGALKSFFGKDYPLDDLP